MSEKSLADSDRLRPLIGIPFFIFGFFFIASKHLFFIFVPFVFTLIFYILITKFPSYEDAWKSCRFLKIHFWVSFLFGGGFFIVFYTFSFDPIDLILVIYSIFVVINLIFLINFCKKIPILPNTITQRGNPDKTP